VAYRGEKVFETLGRDQSKVHAGEQPSERIPDSVFESVPGATNALIPSAVGDKNAVLSHLLFFFSGELGVVGPVRKEVEACKSHQDRCSTFDKD